MDQAAALRRARMGGDRRSDEWNPYLRTIIARCWPGSRAPTSCWRSITTARWRRLLRRRNRRRMRHSTRVLLARAARLYPCVIISGRALDDLTRRLQAHLRLVPLRQPGLEPPPAGCRGADASARVGASSQEAPAARSRPRHRGQAVLADHPLPQRARQASRDRRDRSRRQRASRCTGAGGCRGRQPAAARRRGQRGRAATGVSLVRVRQRHLRGR